MRKEWPTEPVGDVAVFINGLWKGENPPFVNVGVIRNTNFTKEGSLNDSDIAYLDVEARKYEKRRLQYGDIILEKSGGGPKQPVGRVALFNKTKGDFSFSNFTAALRVLSPQKLDFRFLHRFLHWTYISGVTDRMQTNSTGIRNLDADAYKSIKVPVPPLAEQERIVKLLDEADELRRLRTQADQRTATLIPALFHEIFEDRVYGKSKLPLVTYGEISSFITSGSRGWAGYYSNCGAKFIRVQNLTGNRLDFGDIAFVSPPDTAEARRTRVLPNDLLLAITGNTIGLSAFAPTDIGIAHVSQHVAIIRPKPGIDIEYLATFTALKDGAQRQIAELQYGQTKPGLSLAQVRSLHIPVPPLPLQKAFASRVAEIRELEARQAASRQRLDALFQSMLHRAFNGEL